MSEITRLRGETIPELAVEIARIRRKLQRVQAGAARRES
jgi:hypothetical protein